MVPAEVAEHKLDDLPAGVHLQPGELRIEFNGAGEDLLERLQHRCPHSRYGYVRVAFLPFLVLGWFAAQIDADNLACLSYLPFEFGVYPLGEVGAELMKDVPSIAELKQFPCDCFSMQPKNPPLDHVSVKR